MGGALGAAVDLAGYRAALVDREAEEPASPILIRSRASRGGEVVLGAEDDIGRGKGQARPPPRRSAEATSGLGLAPVRIGDIGGDRALLVGADRNGLALGHVDHLARSRRDRSVRAGHR